MVNVASTRVTLCSDFVELGDVPPDAPQSRGWISVAREEPKADGTFDAAADPVPVTWHPPNADGVVEGEPLRFTLGAGDYPYMLFIKDLESATLVDYCELPGATLDDGDTLVVTPRYTQT